MKRNMLILLPVLLLIQIKSIAVDPKLYISTNKEQYRPSENVQFQAIVLFNNTFGGSSLYAELFDCAGNKIIKRVFPMADDFCSGSISLPGNAKPNYYLLYCYIINNDSIKCDFIKRIYISNSAVQYEEKELPHQANDLSFEYFFEGNNLINEISNNILIKSFYTNGKPAIVSGKIMDEKNKTVIDFNSAENGYAKISFIPEANKNYVISVKDLTGNEKVISIPLAAPYGLALDVSVKNATVYYKIKSYTSADDQPLEYRIQVVKNNDTVYVASISFRLSISEVMEKIDGNKLPEGYLTFRVIDKGSKLCAKRIFYNYHVIQKKNNLRLVDSLTKKEIIIDLPEYINGKGYISFSAAKKDTVLAMQGLKRFCGTRQLPLQTNTDSLTMQLNDYMIALQQPLNITNETDSLTSTYLTLNGTLYTKDMKFVKNNLVNIILVQKNLKKQFLQAYTNEQGRLQIKHLVFFDSATVYYQLADKSDERNNIIFKPDPLINAGFDNPIQKWNYLFCSNGSVIPDKNFNYEFNTDSKTLQQVIVKGQKGKTEKEKFEEKNISWQYRDITSMRFEVDFITNPEVVSDNSILFRYLQGRVPGVTLRFDKNGIPNVYANNGAPVQVYLDDMDIPDDDLSVLSELYVKDIALIRYYPRDFKPHFKKGSNEDGGALMLYTKRDNTPTLGKVSSLPKTKIMGYNTENPNLPNATQTIYPQSLLWVSNYNFQKTQTFFTALPQNKPGITVQLKIEGINSANIPFSFIKNLTFE